jgi:hypothetical protein|tara:strand:+ start:470 stop:691 length:222 start_codon:yes stop_codon:yes gene_type:complete
MKTTKEFDIVTFDAWSGGEDTQKRIFDEGKAELFNALMDDIFPEGAAESDVNDYLRFEDDYIFEMLGITDEEE